MNSLSAPDGLKERAGWNNYLRDTGGERECFFLSYTVHFFLPDSPADPHVGGGGGHTFESGFACADGSYGLPSNSHCQLDPGSRGRVGAGKRRHEVNI